MTVGSMRAAVIAVRAGVFDGVDDPDAALIPVEDMPVCVGLSRLRTRRAPWSRDNGDDPVIVVLPGHGGAGASTVALAVAEGLSESCRVQLLDFAEPTRSGLAGASSIELGVEGVWWRRGRRGRLDLFRLADQPADGQLPSPPELEGEGQLLIVDAGWSLTTALLNPCSDGALEPDDQVVVVTRVTVPAVRQTEHVLASVGEGAVVAAVGSARWPRAVQASCGPRLAELRSQGRVVRVPVDRHLERSGLTSDRLPKAVEAAGRTLARLLMPDAPPQPRHRRRTASPRPEPVGESR